MRSFSATGDSFRGWDGDYDSRLEIGGGGSEKVGGVLKVADPHVAVVAEKAADPLARVAVVDVPPLTLAAGLVGAADRTAVALLGDHAVPVGLGEAVFPKGAAALSFWAVSAVVELASVTDWPTHDRGHRGAALVTGATFDPPSGDYGSGALALGLRTAEV
jgi:hypothetical protein